MDSDPAQLDVALNVIDEGVAIFDSTLKLVTWNEQFTSMGVVPRSLLRSGATLLEICVVLAEQGVFGTGKSPEVLAAAHVDAIKSGPLIETDRLTSTTGRTIRIDRFHLQDGGVCATFRDVTEAEQTEAFLRQAAKLDAIGRLTGGIAHDLNNVLAAVAGNLEVAMIEPSEKHDSIHAALDAVDKGAELIHQMMTFARQQPMNISNTRVSSSISSLGNMLKRLVGETINVEMAINPDLWMVQVDASQLESAVMNFVVNAKDAMPDGGVITIAATNAQIDEHYASFVHVKPGPYVCISVTDTGFGMPPDVAGKAFDPFYSTKAPGRGTGLGLSMAHGFARQAEGHIVIDSTQGVGTTIKLYLPRSLDNTEPADHETFAASTDLGVSVLIVEDDTAARHSVTAQLRMLGCSVLSAGSPGEAIRLLAASPVDLLLTDLVMPEMDGVELTARVLKDHPHLAVVHMTGYGPDWSKQATENGIDDKAVVLLQKPFRGNELATALTEALNKAESSRREFNGKSGRETSS